MFKKLTIFTLAAFAAHQAYAIKIQKHPKEEDEYHHHNDLHCENSGRMYVDDLDREFHHFNPDDDYSLYSERILDINDEYYQREFACQKAYGDSEWSDGPPPSDSTKEWEICIKDVCVQTTYTLFSKEFTANLTFKYTVF